MGPHPPAPRLTHREGLWRLLELSKKPIFIVFESQYREITHPAISLLKQHRNLVTLLVWRAGSMVRAKSHLASTPVLYKSAPFCVRSAIRIPVLLRGVPQLKQQSFVPVLLRLLTSQGRAMSCMQQVGPVSLPPCGHAATPGALLSPWLSSQLQREKAEPHRACHSPTQAGLGWALLQPSFNWVPSYPMQTPSSDFWKELCLALPRKVSFQGTMGDPQTQLQEDKDPMLILHSSYLDSRGDPHPDGDLGAGSCPPPPLPRGTDGQTRARGHLPDVPL